MMMNDAELGRISFWYPKLQAQAQMGHIRFTYPMSMYYTLRFYDGSPACWSLVDDWNFASDHNPWMHSVYLLIKTFLFLLSFSSAFLAYKEI